MSTTGIDVESITAKVRQRLGQEFDSDAAARDEVDPDRFVLDTENSYGSIDASDASDAADDPAPALPADPPVASGGEGSEGEGVSAPPTPDPSDNITLDDTEPLAPSEPEVVFQIPGVTDDEPSPSSVDTTTEPEPEPAPTPTPTSSDRFDYTTYFELMYGEVPPVEQVEASFAFVERMNQLPPEYQQIVGAMLDGRFDPVEFAKAVIPDAATARDEDDDLFDPSPSTSRTPDPHVARLEREVQQMRAIEAQREAQRREQLQQQVMAGVDQAMTDFRTANRHLTAEQFAVLARKVNSSPGWVAEVERGADPHEAYLRHLTATALSDPRFASTLVPVANPNAPTPDPRPRQAANAAIAGTNSPSAPNPSKRRSPLGDGSPRTPRATPKNVGELREAMKDGVNELFG